MGRRLQDGDTCNPDTLKLLAAETFLGALRPIPSVRWAALGNITPA